MDNIGDWLYIVLLVVAGISSLISSAKKKREKTVAPQPPQEVDIPVDSLPTKGFWEMFEEELAPQEVVVAQKPVRLKEPKSERAFASILDSANIRSAGRFTSDAPILQEGNDESSFSVAGGVNLQDMDELRKAIVYGEILRRNY